MELTRDTPASEQPLISNPRAVVLHLWAFVLPLITLTYWLTGPHPWWASIAWLLPIVVLVMIDNHSPNDFRQPREDMPHWPFNLQCYALFALQMANHIMLGVVASRMTFHGWMDYVNAVAMLVPVSVLAGTTAGYSGIVLAHEFVHRRNPIEYLMGRVLLMFVMNEQFATEHIRGHHPRIGTRKDPATARFGETHRDFVRRTIPAQFVSAWRLEKVRLGDPKLKPGDLRWLRHRVLQGVVAELAILTGFAMFSGWLALLYFLVQSRTAVILLETVNYIEHWGLLRVGKKVMAIDSWDTDNWFTLYTLIGLSRHADHHAQAARPYEKLRYFEETAKMPRGYYGTVLMALFRNEKYMELATEELKRKGLGPFRNDEVKAQPRSHIHPALLAARADEDEGADAGMPAAASA